MLSLSDLVSGVDERLRMGRAGSSLGERTDDRSANEESGIRLDDALRSVYSPIGRASRLLGLALTNVGQTAGIVNAVSQY